ncbi:alpha-amylase family protein [Janibacter sp. GXQ6167]|uniref:alpha-amylase family protein n=1 Tax=Janibacter sp. GXQ6167 TaxID=3240791 RepID=UPI0035241B6C
MYEAIAALIRADLLSAYRLDPAFLRRFDAHFPRLAREFLTVYGDRVDALLQLRSLAGDLVVAWEERPDELHLLDNEREHDTTWYASEQMVGAMAYVDRWAGDLDGVRAQIPYLRDLGISYLHLMPLFAVPDGDHDGGYAISSYRDVRPDLGTTEDLAELARDLRAAGISLCLDLVFNHTAHDHPWALQAADGVAPFDQYYWIFPDRTMPDAYERTVREIFPDDHPGSFVPLGDGRWAWATFHRYQWDLRYANPEVFRAMAREMLSIAALGVEVLRMDAVAFIWKELGTPSESLPQVHHLLRAFNAICRIVAPAVVFKSEAIVHPDEVATYIDTDECQLSYNPLQMALVWEGLATTKPLLLQQALTRRHALPPGTQWVNYVRSHDDIGWTFADEDAAELGIDGHDHRRFLNAWYTGRHEGSWARGVPFQENPRTGDARISGTTADLLGLVQGDPFAVDRITLAYGIAMLTGGIPLLYLGDEVGQLGDPDDPLVARDTRWVHRPPRPEERYAQAGDPSADAGRVYAALRDLIALRRAWPDLAGNALTPFDPRNEHVLGFTRGHLLVLANFSPWPQHIAAEVMSGQPKVATDAREGGTRYLRDGVELTPYELLVLDVTGAGWRSGSVDE